MKVRESPSLMFVGKASFTLGLPNVRDAIRTRLKILLGLIANRRLSKFSSEKPIPNKISEINEALDLITRISDAENDVFLWSKYAEV